MTTQLFRKTATRTFSAHNMLLRAAWHEIELAETSEVGRFNRCLAAMVMTSLAVEALVNAVGKKVADDWTTFEKLKPADKITSLVDKLGIQRNERKAPWTTLRFLGGFRNDIAHGKPEELVETRVLPGAGLTGNYRAMPRSKLEREITLGNAKRTYAAVRELRGLFTDALTAEANFGIPVDMWHESTTPEVTTGESHLRKPKSKTAR